MSPIIDGNNILINDGRGGVAGVSGNCSQWQPAPPPISPAIAPALHTYTTINDGCINGGHINIDDIGGRTASLRAHGHQLKPLKTIILSIMSYN
jgi:hypothetical protein